MAFALDPKLRDYATDRQWEILETWEREGSQTKAAKKLKINQSTLKEAWDYVKRKAAKQGYAPEYDFKDKVPDGFKLARHSQYYDGDGNPKNRWIIATPDRERQLEMMREAIAGLSDDLPRYEPVPAPRYSNDELCVAYPVGDHHFGMLAWDKETGADWDLKIAEIALKKSIDYLTSAAPPARKGLLVFLGDYMHYDGFIPQTQRSKNVLDSDSRFPKMIRGGVRTIRYTIAAVLAKHEEVEVIIEIGNHDDASAIWLMELLSIVFENEPRIKINTSPMRMHYSRFGKNLIGVTHSDQVKMQDMPLIMAMDCKEDWGQTIHRFVWTGHFHSKKQLQLPVSAVDVGGISCECFRILAPADAWASGMGYRSIRNMHSIVLHAEHGEMSRNTVNPAMFRL